MAREALILTSDTQWDRFRRELAASPSQEILQREADHWLAENPLSIVDKTHLALSGDPHDYVSMSPYWWPDPAKPDGLPYVIRDGEVNPRFYEYDSRRKEIALHAVLRLILQAHAGHSAEHGRAAGRRLRTWFLDEATRMNPHLQYAQFVPGLCEGRGIGIIDTNDLVFLLDAVARLDFSEDWRPDDLTGLKCWFSDYLDWLLTSKNGQEEAAARNNHGTWYDAQVVAFACFCDRPEIAERQLAVTETRLASQLSADGSQPHELARTLSYTYCTFNLIGFACLALMARRFDRDLWRWATPNRASLAAAVEWMLPYYADGKAWTHQQLKTVDLSAPSLLLGLAGEASGETRLTELAWKLAPHPWQLISFSKAEMTGRKRIA